MRTDPGPRVEAVEDKKPGTEADNFGPKKALRIKVKVWDTVHDRDKSGEQVTVREREAEQKKPSNTA
eukprot:2012761-Pyramimonas_sp.AAC.1